MRGHNARMDVLVRYWFVKVSLISSEMGLDGYKEWDVFEGANNRLWVIGEDLLHLF